MGDINLEVDTLILLGSTYSRISEYHQALEQFNQVLSLSQQIGNQLQQAKVWY